MPTGRVKFFNHAKGFGFIGPDDGSSDVFVHISGVERSGLDGLNEGDQVAYEIEQDRRSGKLAAVDLQWIGAGSPSPGNGRGRSERRNDRPQRGGPPPGGDRISGGPGAGVVKWFNPKKGFGFIQPNDGGSEVFVHISAVERAGLWGLDEGQSVSYEVERDPRTGKVSATNLRVDS